MSEIRLWKAFYLYNFCLIWLISQYNISRHSSYIKTRLFGVPSTKNIHTKFKKIFWTWNWKGLVDYWIFVSDKMLKLKKSDSFLMLSSMVECVISDVRLFKLSTVAPFDQVFHGESAKTLINRLRLIKTLKSWRWTCRQAKIKTIIFTWNRRVKK